MRSVHLTLLVFCHVLLASVVFYFISLAAASPLLEHPTSPNEALVSKPVAKQTPANDKQHADSGSVSAKQLEQKSSAPAAPAAQQTASAQSDKPKESVVKPDSVLDARSVFAVQSKLNTAELSPSSKVPTQDGASAQAPISKDQTVVSGESDAQLVLTERKVELKKPVKAEAPSSPVGQPQEANKSQEMAPKSAVQSVPANEDAVKKVAETETKTKNAKAAAPSSPFVVEQTEPVKMATQEKVSGGVPQAAALVAEHRSAPVDTPMFGRSGSPHEAVPVQPVKQEAAAAPSVVTKETSVPVVKQAVEQAARTAVGSSMPAAVAPQSPVAAEQGAKSPAAPLPVVMGGLGPLHLLATTLCSYQPDKQVADENLNQLYARRASVRKSLFDFMSLKFTNLEKLSSRLGYGLQVVPVKSSEDNKSPGMLPTHGWPVVGKCTAHDLKLMGEAAWCECQETEGCSKPEDKTLASVDEQEEQPPKITSNQHNSKRVMSARAIGNSPASYSFLPSPEESSVISRILHVSDMKNAPIVESSIYNLNLTQQQLATLEAHATSTNECRRNALRYTKALFNHLAEDQKNVSESWPRLYALISTDDCARKRMIDIVNALSGFRTDTTSIRRDNLEFAFAMDDLRAKVLETEVNMPLTFDRHFIEVEQFLQQSVRLMLANVQPKRAKLTSMRYRSLMYGASSDEQCIDLHQRLLAKNYPNDCNPTQFGQLPDVLRMTASSLELWSIEKELSLHMAKIFDYPNAEPAGQQKVREDVNECIANLVSS